MALDFCREKPALAPNQVLSCFNVDSWGAASPLMHVGDCGVTTAVNLDIRISDSFAFNDGPPRQCHGRADNLSPLVSNNPLVRGTHQTYKGTWSSKFSIIGCMTTPVIPLCSTCFQRSISSIYLLFSVNALAPAPGAQLCQLTPQIVPEIKPEKKWFVI